MSAFKKLNRQDVYVSHYVAKKRWNASDTAVGGYNIETLRGFSGSTPGYPYPSDFLNNRYQKLVYDSINQLYYRDGEGEGLFSGSANLSLQSSLTLSGSRDIQTEVAVLSFPRGTYGTHIEPGTFQIHPLSESQDSFNVEGYFGDYFTGEDEFVEKAGFWYGSNPLNTEDYYVSESIHTPSSSLDMYVSESLDSSPGQYVDIEQDQQMMHIVDDGNGCLIFSGSELKYTEPRKVVGDIIYNQGQVIFTDPVVARYISTYSRHKLQWKSNVPIYTYNVSCIVRDSELNFTYNPSAVSGSDGVLKDNITGSAFTPYITSIGLYNDSNELIAVAKTNKPIPKSTHADMTFEVKIDI